MSIDGYFCLCCLSTNDLSNLFDSTNEENYVLMLKDLFSIVPSENYEEDSYICEECRDKLKQAYDFKTHVLDTLNKLQVNKLLELNEINGDIIIQKVTNPADVENKRRAGVIKIEVDLKQLLPDNNSHNQQITDGSVKTIDNDKTKKFGSKIKSTQRRDCTKEIYKLVEADDFTCKLCKKSLPSRYMYNLHINEHFPNHICELCGKGFLTERRLKRHSLSHQKGPFFCQVCDAVFNNYNTLLAHRQRKHTRVPLYSCPKCPERFPTFTRRALHLSTMHAQTSRHCCPICQKTFLMSGLLSVHIRNKHLKVKRHFCEECGAGYFHRQDLVSHVASHTGLKQFHCQICSKSYSRKNALTVHMRKHSNEKPFCCDACGKKFTQKCTLMKHMEIHNRIAEKERNKRIKS